MPLCAITTTTRVAHEHVERSPIKTAKEKMPTLTSFSLFRSHFLHCKQKCYSLKVQYFGSILLNE